MKEAHGVRVSLKPSRAASILVGASCVGSAALVAWLPGDPALRAAIVAALAIYAIAAMRRWALRSTSHAIAGIEVDLDCRVCLVERNGARIEGVLWPDSYVSAWLTTVVVRLDGRRRARSTAIVPTCFQTRISAVCA